VVAHHFTEAGLAREALDYWCKAGQLASMRSAKREAVRSFEEAVRIIDTLPESKATLERAFEIRLELRWC
jgi:predicted ATPase